MSVDFTKLSPERQSAVALFNQGVAAYKSAEPNVDLSLQMISSSVEHDPTLAVGWREISQRTWEARQMPATIAAMRRMLEIPVDDSPGGMTAQMFAESLANLGHRLYYAGKLKEAREFTMQALERDPSLDGAWVTLSLIESFEGNHTAAIQHAEKAFAMKADPINEVALAFALLFDRQWARGLRHFEARFPHTRKQFLAYPYPKWEGQDVRDKTVFICTDQGLGDTLSFARFVPMVAGRARAVKFIVQSEAVRVLSAALQYWPNVEVIPANTPFPQADYWTTPMSLPYPLGLADWQIEKCPPLDIPIFHTMPTWKAPGRKLHIGIVWAGSDLQEIERWRRVPMELFLDLYQVPGIQLYSLQKGSRSGDVHSSGAVTLIKDLSPYINDVADTMAIMQHLDLVITIETSVGHMASLMGKECWILYSRYGQDFRIGRTGEKPLWSPNHRVFRQHDDAKWEPVMAQVVEALREKVK